MVKIVAKYIYTTYRPPPHRMARDETPTHRFMYVKRRDIIDSKNVGYMARCTCGWKDGQGQYWPTKTPAKRQWEKHMDSVNLQEELWQ